nr:hypothetical protein [Tanacetum cinerariifolium]GEY42486.1 hypothetical protein [Tanacetum cinerariifolium]
MEVNIEEDGNELELTYPYEDVNPLNHPSPASESEPEDAIEVENPIEHEDETVPTSFHEVGESSATPFLRKDSDGLLLGLMKRDINSLFSWMASLSRRLCGRETTHALVKKKGKKRTSIMENVNAAIAVERARQANAGNDAKGSRPVRGQDVVPAVRECTFAGFMKCNPTAFHGTEGAVELLRWFKKTKSVFGISECAEGKNVKFAAATLQGPALTWWNVKIVTTEEVQRIEHEFWNLKVKEYNIVAYTQRFNELALMCPRTVNPERVKVDAYIRGLTNNVKGENNQKQAIKRAMVTTLADGRVSSRSLPLCKHCFTRHVGPCTIKCHKCGKVAYKIRCCKEKNVATGVNALPIPTSYDCGEQGHARNRCPRKVKQEEVGEVHGRAYDIKDAELKGPNVVTGTFLLNNRYAFVLLDSGFDRSFVDTRFSSMLNIDPVKIGASYEVELADGRVVSTNTILKRCTLKLVNYIFKIDLMPIKLGTFNVIIGMDWLVKHDACKTHMKNTVNLKFLQVLNHDK